MKHTHVFRYDGEDKDEELEFMRMMKSTCAYNALFEIQQHIRLALQEAEYEEGCGKTYEALDLLRERINNEILDQGIDLERELP